MTRRLANDTRGQMVGYSPRWVIYGAVALITFREVSLIVGGPVTAAGLAVAAVGAIWLYRLHRDNREVSDPT